MEMEKNFFIVLFSVFVFFIKVTECGPRDYVIEMLGGIKEQRRIMDF